MQQAQLRIHRGREARAISDLLPAVPSRIKRKENLANHNRITFKGTPRVEIPARVLGLAFPE
jgi:hypothetical protein